MTPLASQSPSESEENQSKAALLSWPLFYSRKNIQTLAKIFGWIVFCFLFVVLAILSYLYPEVTGPGFFWEILFIVLAILFFRAGYLSIINIYNS